MSDTYVGDDSQYGQQQHHQVQYTDQQYDDTMNVPQDKYE